MIAGATWIRFNSYDEVREKLLGNSLPFKQQFIDQASGLPRVPKVGTWYPQVVEEIARVFKQIRDTGDESLVPDWSFLEQREPAPYRSEDRDGGERCAGQYT